MLHNEHRVEVQVIGSGLGETPHATWAMRGFKRCYGGTHVVPRAGLGNLLHPGLSLRKLASKPTRTRHDHTITHNGTPRHLLDKLDEGGLQSKHQPLHQSVPGHQTVTCLAYHFYPYPNCPGGAQHTPVRCVHHRLLPILQGFSHRYRTPQELSSSSVFHLRKWRTLSDSSQICGQKKKANVSNGTSCLCEGWALALRRTKHRLEIRGSDACNKARHLFVPFPNEYQLIPGAVRPAQDNSVIFKQFRRVGVAMRANHAGSYSTGSPTSS